MDREQELKTFYTKKELINFGYNSPTNGSTLRFWDEDIFVKFKSERMSKECVCEVLASNMGISLGLPVLEYDLCYVDLQDGSDPYLGCCSIDYRGKGDTVLTIPQVRNELFEPGWGYYGGLCRLSGETLINQILVFDFIIGNSDRHLSNIEYLVHSDGTFNMAPIFDSGRSLLQTYAPYEAMWKLEQSENCFLNFGRRFGIFDVVKNAVAINKIDWFKVLEGVRPYITHDELSSIIKFVEFSKNMLKERGILCEKSTT